MVGLFLLGLWAASAHAQGLLVVVNSRTPVPLPRPVFQPPLPPPMTYKIRELSVNARVLDQVARVQVGQSFVNTGSLPMEVQFVFPLPYDGAVDQLTFLVDGKEYPAKLLPAAQARAIYESHVRRNRDPALLEWLGTGMFQTSVFPVPPGAERKVTLRYSQLLRKDRDLTDFLFPLGTAKYTSQAVELVDIRLAIESAVEIKTVYSPTHAIDVKRPDATHAVVSYTSKNQVPTADFRLFYGVARGQIGASVLSYRPDDKEDGYLLLLASPQIKADQERPAKTVVCVFDRSGSMSGKKIEQAREALKFVINNLREGDLFNVIAYDTQVEAFRPELQRFSDDSRKQALGFVEGMYAGGGTNISGALDTAMKMLPGKLETCPTYLIFMTDGLPTVGELNEGKIIEAVGKANPCRARLITLGVGYDVNSRLLDRLARANFGHTDYIRPEEDIEVHVARLAGKISSPVMTDVAVKFDFDDAKVEAGPPVNRIYPQHITDLFEGEQLVVVARYKKPGRAKVAISGRVAGKQQGLDFPADLTARSSEQSYAFVEKLWAMRRIGEIIDQLDLHGKNDELIKELVELSTRHGVLTPYTAFLADENAGPGPLAFDHRAGARHAGELVERLKEAEGKAAFSQRDFKKQLRGAEVAASPEPSAKPRAGRGEATDGAVLRDIDSDSLVRVDAVRVLEGGKTLYRRGNVWYAYDAVKQDMQKLRTETKIVERFSEEYFDIVRAASPATKRVLARQQPAEAVVIEHDGKMYHVK
jgi:Ca-activated chloride channel family protein